MGEACNTCGRNAQKTLVGKRMKRPMGRPCRRWKYNITFAVVNTVTLIIKTVPLQAWTDPELFQEVKVPRFRDNGTEWW